jgi:hypothetical protein
MVIAIGKMKKFQFRERKYGSVLPPSRIILKIGGEAFIGGIKALEISVESKLDGAGEDAVVFERGQSASEAFKAVVFAVFAFKFNIKVGGILTHQA